MDDAPGSGGGDPRAGAPARELDQVYGSDDVSDPVVAGFQELVRRTGLPRGPADELLDGMEMDIGVVRFRAVGSCSSTATASPAPSG